MNASDDRAARALLLRGFPEIDRHFALLMDDLASVPSDGLALAAALVSHRRGQGHTCLELQRVAGVRLDELVEEGDGSGARLPDLAGWTASLRASGVVGSPGEYAPLVLDPANRLYLHRYWRYETDLAAAIRARAVAPVAIDGPRLDADLDQLFPEHGDGSGRQREAVRMAATRAFSVVTGGPGTGKTRTVVWLLAALLGQQPGRPLRIALAAPTGKAAARIAEAVRKAKADLPGDEASKERLPEQATTLHRLLGTVPGSSRFRHDAAHPLAVDVVVVDEASMVDVALMAKLFAALPPAARIVLVGDKDQLASVEAGNVLGEICAGGPAGAGHPLARCRVALDKNWRFADGAGIHALVTAVNAGDADAALGLLRREVDAGTPSAGIAAAGTDDFAGPGSGGAVRWRRLPSPQRIPDALLGTVLEAFGPVVGSRDPAAALAALERFRLLAAVRRGPFGVENLNRVCETLLDRAGLIRRRGEWYAGRPVMVTRNDPGLLLHNGDVGIALPDPADAGNLRVCFAAADGSVRFFAPARLPAHETAFAMTVHKSQGSEFDRVLLVLPERDSPLLTRELVYTGLTRARSSVELWADEPVLRAAIGRQVLRGSGLRDALWAPLSADPSRPSA